MRISFIPDWIVDSVTDLTPQLLAQRGIRFLMLDFDNTIVPYTNDVPEEDVLSWIRAMQSGGVVLCMVSNSKRARVRIFCETYGIPCIQHARKPFWWIGIREAQRRFGYAPGESAMVGDQIYTDVLGGNGAGVVSVLVTPIHLHNIWLKLRHVAEKPFIFWGKRRNHHEKY